MSKIDIQYNSYDFFYVKAGDKTPTEERCYDYKMIPDSSCSHFPTISDVFLDEINNCSQNDPDDIIGCLNSVDYNNFGRTTYADDYQNWIIWEDNSFNCYKKELCHNRELADEITKMQEDHLGTEENYNNSKASYNNELLKTGNLTMGILGLMILIYYTR
jgi:hypothetical protein